MGTLLTHGLGRDLRFYVVKEGAATPKDNYGTNTQVAFAAASDSAKVLSTAMTFNVARDARADARTTRSVLERITGKQEVSWSCETYMLPRGSSYVPNIGPLIEGAMGSVSTVTYSLANALPTVHLARGCPSVFREDVFGGWVEEMTITASGGEPIKMSFSGGAMEYALTGTATTGTGTTSASLALGTNEAFSFMPGSKIQVADTSASDGLIVIGNSAHNTSTLSASATFGSSKAVTPHLPDQTTQGNPVAGITGSVVLGGTTLTVTGFDLTLTNNVAAISDEFGEKGVSDFVAGFRTVTGSITVRAQADFINSFAKRYTTAGPEITDGVPSFTTVAIVLTMGQTADFIQILNLPKCELDFGSIDVPEADEVILNIPFTALGNSGNDEFTFEWNNG